jgi:alpha-galactosidase
MLLGALFCQGAIASQASGDLRDAWRDHAGDFPKAARAGAGFSFRYAGENIGPQFSDAWQKTLTQETTHHLSRLTLTHASGLSVTREMRVFSEFGDAVEYRLRFKNISDRRIAAVSALHALNISFASPVDSGTCVLSSGGGLADGFYPPRSFALRTRCFAPTVPDFGELALTTEGGRSSSQDLPFFFVQNDASRQGLFVAFGWTGQWGAVVQRDAVAGVLTIRGRIPGLEIALEPGEEIQGPTILVGLYEGSVAEGSNQLRRLIRERYTPRLAGRPYLPAMTYDHFWNIGVDFDEPLLKKLADAAAAIGEENFLLDAGWYAGTGKGYDFAGGLGNWYDVDKTRFPNGLEPFADYVRSRNLKFGLWFEPERVAEGSRLAKEHPDWILWEQVNGLPRPWGRETDPENPVFQRRYGLLDYGRPEVQEWVRNLLDHYIRQYSVRYIRYDFNLSPLPYWEAHDGPGRRGITQLRHIQGFYSVLDWIRERHPDTVLEGCAAGGLRIDLETARRFHTFWISDYTVDPSIVRFHLLGINAFLPGNYHYVQYTLPAPGQKDFAVDDLGFQSMFGGAFGIGGRIDLWPEAMQRKARLEVDRFKDIRRYLVEDFYSLRGQPSDVNSWSGWQFHDPRDQSGFVQTFRIGAATADQRFVIYGLQDKTRYRFTELNTGQRFQISGAQAMNAGIDVKQPPNSSRIFVYRLADDEPLGSSGTAASARTSSSSLP